MQLDIHARTGRGPTAVWPVGVAVAALALATGAAADSPSQLAARIDRHLEAGWRRRNETPAPPADDATFVRRAYLDLVGRIPTVAEVRVFLADSVPDKRGQLTCHLIDSAAHARHSAAFWRREWLPQTDTPQFAELAEPAENWLAAQLRDGAGYDRMVLALLMASRGRTPPGTRPLGEDRPVTFLAVSEYLPENLAANAARAFLGINLDCARCHNHPTARWTREQFWQTAAFFTRPPNGGPGRLELTIPGTEQVVTAAFLSAPSPAGADPTGDEAGRLAFADWVTAKDNPYFARNAVNRLWANFFGAGLVEPLDALPAEKSPASPELLDDLAAAFAASGFDLKGLAKAMTLCRAYSLSSVVPAGAAAAPPRFFSRMPVRALSGEQLYDSLRLAAGFAADRDDLDPIEALRERKQFATRFRIERAASGRRSILQALALMNGKAVARATNVNDAPALRAVADAPFLDERGKIEALFLAALGRKPAADEAAPLVQYLRRGGADGDAKKALADVFWALLNGSEFATNH